MELFVCIKQVPDDSVTIVLDDSGEPKLSGITPVVNPFDTYALEMAVRFKEAHGGSVTVMSVDSADVVAPSLRSCLAVGGDRAYVVNEATKSDSSGTAYLLAQAVKNIGEYFDVIFCGSESTDTANTQMGVRLAHQLGIPVVTNVLALEPVENGLSVKQETENGYRVIEVSCPCVITVVKPGYEPRYPSIKSKMAARKMPIGTLTASEIGAHDAQFGHEAALTKRVGIATPPQRQSGVKIREKDAAEAVRQAMELLAEAKLI